MFKLFSMLLFAGAMAAEVNVAVACGCGPGQAAAPAATARAPQAPTAVTQNGRQSIRRYSAAPAPSYRAPAYRAPTMRRSRTSSGPSWNATRKVLGY